jgi:hypothetical protein
MRKNWQPVVLGVMFSVAVSIITAPAGRHRILKRPSGHGSGECDYKRRKRPP